MKRLLAVAFILMIFVIQIPLSAQTPNAAAYLNYGNQLYAAKDYTKAITYYKYATTLDPSNTAAFQGLGNCYYYLGQKPEALAAYQRAKTLNPSLTQLDPVIQYLQTQVNSNPANPSLPTSNFSAVGGATGGEKKTELDIMIGGALPLSGSDLLPSSLGTGMTLPSLAGGFGIGFGGGLGVYFPMGSNLSIGVNGAVYAYGANFNYSAPLYGENEGVTETINQTNIEIAAAVKYRLGEGGGNQTQPYLLGGLGFALISNSGSVTELDTYNGTVEYSYGYSMPSSSTLCPMAQIGGGVQFPAGNNMNFFAEGKFNFILVGGATETVSALNLSYQTPGYTIIEFPINVGLNFNLKHSPKMRGVPV